MPRLTALLAALASLAAALPCAARDRAWVVVGTARARAALQPLIAHRRAEGLTVVALDAPTGAAAERRARLRAQLRGLTGRPAYLLLAGSARAIPTFVRDRVATDRPYADLDDDGTPDLALGRFPTDDPGELRRLAERTVRYERAPGAGPWRKRLALIAGEGRFSPIVDTLIELIFSQVVRDAVHPAYDVDLTYANPRSRYCYPPARFADHVARSFERGALVFAYIGHGAVRAVDAVTVPGPPPRRFPVLDARRARRLRAKDPAVFVAIACLTARFEGRGRCIGQELLAAPGGPVAFLGATRVSHPVHNALFAQALVRQLLASAGSVRLGPAIDRAKREMVSGGKGLDLVRLEVITIGSLIVGREAIRNDMQRHVDMYVLLGDPALKLARPQALAPVRAPRTVLAGGALVVRGALPGGGTVRLSLAVPRGQSARPDPAPGETPAERYARANAREVLHVTTPTDAEGLFATVLSVPPALPPGEYWLKAFGGQGNTTALGAARVRVLRR